VSERRKSVDDDDDDDDVDTDDTEDSNIVTMMIRLVGSRPKDAAMDTGSTST